MLKIHSGHFLFIFLLIFTGISCQKQEEVQTLLPKNFPGGSVYNPNDTTPISWNPDNIKSSPLNIAVSSEFDGDIVSGIHPVINMMTIWNNSISINFFNLHPSFVVNKDLNDLSDYQDNEMGIYKSHKWFSDVTSNALAVTQYFAYRKNSPYGGTYYEMSHADIVLNYRDFSFSSPPLGLNQFDLRSVLIHEMGHMLGLQHNSSAPGAIMYPYLDDQEVRITPSQDDKNKLSLLYNGHLSALSSPSGMASYSEEENIPWPPSIRVIVEMDADHRCRHFINNKIIYEHPW